MAPALTNHSIRVPNTTGLNAKVDSGTQKAKAEMAELRAENAALKVRLENLEQLLTNQLNGGTQ